MLLQNIHVIHELINLILLHDDASTAIKELKFLWNIHGQDTKRVHTWMYFCQNASQKCICRPRAFLDAFSRRQVGLQQRSDVNMVEIQ